MLDIGHLGKKVLQPDLRFWCGLNHFNISNEGVQALLRHWRDCTCILFDPIGSVDLCLSIMGIARPHINGDYGKRARKGTGIVSKYTFHDTWHGLNRSVTKQVCAV
jgi:hypothetical protein